MLILLIEPNNLLAEELQNIDLDSDSCITSQKIVNFNQVKQLEIAFEKDKPLEK